MTAVVEEKMSWRDVSTKKYSHSASGQLGIRPWRVGLVIISRKYYIIQIEKNMLVNYKG